MKKKKSESLIRMVSSAMLIALATVLSLIKIWQMPLGGSVTLLSMLPIVVISIRYGVKWGFFCSFIYSLIQIALGLPELMAWGMTVEIWIGCLVFDYILAYGVLGIAGLFRKKGTGGICAGVIIALALRMVSHFISGTIFFASWCPEGWNVYLYSLAYNGAYMLPEAIFTSIAAIMIFKIPSVRKTFLDGGKED